jgi:hypothetical protein
MRQREVTAESLHELLLRSSQSVSSTSQPIISGQGLDKNLKQARAFYTLILLSTGVGVGLDFVGVNPVKAL